MVTAFKFDSAISSAVFDGYRSLTRTGSGASGNGIFSIGKDTAWNSFNDATAVFTTTNLTVGSLGGLLKATAGVVGVASSGTDYEPPVTKGNLTESGSSIITFGGNTSNNVIGAGTTISIQKASAAQDGYLGKNDFATFSASTHSPVTLNASAITGGLSLNTQEISFRAADTTYDGYLKSSDWDTFNGKQNALTPGDISSGTASVIEITNGNDSTIGPNVTIAINKASASLDGYLGKDDWSLFNGKQDAITKYDLSETSSSILSITGGTDSVLTNDVTIAVQKASAAQDGYLGKDNWATFNGKMSGAGTVVDNSIVRFEGTSGSSVQGSKTYINDDGYIGINNTNPLGEIHAKSNSWVDVYLETAGNYVDDGSYVDFLRTRGSISSKSVVLVGDTLGHIISSGWDGASYIQSSFIESFVDGTPESNIVPGGIKFRVQTASGSNTEAMRIKSSGKIGIGVAEPSSALDVAGSVEVTLSEWFYIGDPSTNGSWRMGLDAGEFVFQKRIAGAWVTKGTFA